MVFGPLFNAQDVTKYKGRHDVKAFCACHVVMSVALVRRHLRLFVALILLLQCMVVVIYLEVARSTTETNLVSSIRQRLRGELGDEGLQLFHHTVTRRNTYNGNRAIISLGNRLHDTDTDSDQPRNGTVNDTVTSLKYMSAVYSENHVVDIVDVGLDEGEMTKYDNQVHIDFDQHPGSDYFLNDVNIEGTGAFSARNPQKPVCQQFPDEDVGGNRQPEPGFNIFNDTFSQPKPYNFSLPKACSTAHEFIALNPPFCFINGTRRIGTIPDLPNTLRCLCKPGWYGQNCSVPDFVFFSAGGSFIRDMIPRSRYRRVINALAFNVEFELLEARMHELNDVVDVFVVFESNFSNYGEPKPLRLWQRLQKGFLRKFSEKIVYIVRDFFPETGKTNGWYVDEHMREFIGKEGLSRIMNTQPDDLFIYTDADEIPSREAVRFLRLHDGYPEPFGFTLRWSVFGFFWKQAEPTLVYGGCSLRMMREVFTSSAYELRTGDVFMRNGERVNKYMSRKRSPGGGPVYEWYLGDPGYLTGWHCSWCLPPEGIRIKLQSAINADFPRWGDYPEKQDLGYIHKLVKKGIWFDDVMRFDSLVSQDNDTFLAPQYLLNNYKRFKRMLDIRYA